MKNLKEKALELETKMDEMRLYESLKKEYDDDLNDELVENGLVEDYSPDYIGISVEFENLQNEVLSNFRFLDLYISKESGSVYYSYDASFDSEVYGNDPVYDVEKLYKALNSEYEMDFQDYDPESDTELNVEFQLRKSGHGHAHGGFALSCDPDSGFSVVDFFLELEKLNKLVESFKK